jgi:RNA-directed DNA polymerase
VQWKKWLARRHRGESAFQWTRLNAILKRYPLPPARIVHRLYANASETLP